MFGNQDGGEVEEEKCVLALGIEFFSPMFFHYVDPEQFSETA